MDMTSKKLKTLAVAVVLSLTVGAVPPVTGTEIPMITTTVKAAAKKLSLKASSKKVYAGRSVRINAKSTRGAKLSYKTSNKKIATVNRNGVVTGKKAGTVKITITAKKSKYKTVKRTITVKVVKQNQNISARNMELTTGQRTNLGAKARTPMTYKSSNPKIVSVDKKGNLKALRSGTAKITVYAKATEIFNKASRTITVKVTKKTAVKPTTAPKPVQPETKPTVKPVQPETKPTEKPVQPEVKPTETPSQPETPDNTSYVTDLNIEKTADDTIYIGEAKECNVKWKATGNTTRTDFIYTSSDPSVATVDENGNITGVKAGKVIITVTSKTPFAKGGSCLDTSKKYTVEAYDNDAYENGVGFKNPSNVDEKGRNVGIGETINPLAEDTGAYSPENMAKYLTFSSSDPSVATIDAQGNITGVSTGYVTFTVKTKLPVEPTGTYYKEGSATYHVGDYTYEEILNGLTVDMEASRTAHNRLNELRQDKSKRPAVSQICPEAPAREWQDSCFQSAVVRGSRNIICEVLDCWNPGENPNDGGNPLAIHGGSQNGYGGSGWDGSGADLGLAAEEFFYDLPHAANQTDVNDRYSAVAVIQYKNEAGINLTSMIVDMTSCTYEEEKENSIKHNRIWADWDIELLKVPSNQYYDICNHFGLSWGMEQDTVISAGSPDETFSDGTEETAVEEMQEAEVVSAEPETDISEETVEAEDAEIDEETEEEDTDFVSIEE